MIKIVSYTLHLFLRTGFLFLLLLIIGCASPEKMPSEPLKTSDKSWDRYRPATVSEIKATLSHFPDKHVGMTINAEATAKPYRLKAVYLDDLREMSPFRKQFIQQWWGVTFRISPDFTRLFEQELLIEAEEEQFWMPVQTQLIPYFQAELRKGDVVDLFVMVVGTIDHDNWHEWIFIINEFRKQ